MRRKRSWRSGLERTSNCGKSRKKGMMKMLTDMGRKILGWVCGVCGFILAVAVITGYLKPEIGTAHV